MKINSRIGYLLVTLAVASLTFFGGCKTKQLEKGGAYAPGSWSTNTDGSTTFTATGAEDPVLYKIDAAYDLAYTFMDTAFNAERNNRAYLWSISHDIKHTLDDIRPKAADANQRFLKARRIYLLNPTPAGLSDLETVLSEIQNLSSAATAVIPKPNK